MEWPEPFGSVDNAALQVGVQFTTRHEYLRTASGFENTATQARNAHFQSLNVGNAVDFAVKPAAHLYAGITTKERHQTKLSIELFPELHTSSAHDPGRMLGGIQTKWDRGKKLRRRGYTSPVIARTRAHFSSACPDSFKSFERRSQLAAAIYRNFNSARRHLLH